MEFQKAGVDHAEIPTNRIKLINMFIKYQESILQELEKKKADKTLSMRISQPTLAKLKEECIEVCKARYKRKDENILSLFFGKQEDQASYVKAINRFENPKFKPLLNFINRQTAKPDTRVVELLAWLIDFEPRPWDIGRNYEGDSEGSTLTAVEQKEEEEQEKPAKLTEQLSLKASVTPQKKGFNRRTLVVSIVVLLLCSSAYWFWKMQMPGTGLSGHEACMYWNVDHYVQISCNKKVDGAMVIALDSAKMNNFKRIMNADTITYAAINKVWYIKKGGQIEYYTAGGTHPIYPTLILKPISAHIIRTYIFTKQSGNNNN